MKIAFTGGGTIGHVAVNLALIPVAHAKGIETIYIGSKQGIEREMVETQFPDVSYFPISSGKLRRYISVENAKDIFKVQKGVLDAYRILKRERPDFVFSKGGFVSVPVIVAAKLLNIPSIIHESDVTPGLANKISLKLADKLYTTFEETLNYVPAEKADYVGAIIREDLFTGNRSTALELTNFNAEKKVLMIMGGSLGSKLINDTVRKNLDKLLAQYQIIHITGKGQIDSSIDRQGYYQVEFVKEELPHLYKITDTVVSRAGANAIFEFLNLKIPMVLIPLGTDQSRGDQIENAKLFEKGELAEVISEEHLTGDALLLKLESIENKRDEIIERMGMVKTSYTPETLLDKIITDTH